MRHPLLSRDGLLVDAILVLNFDARDLHNRVVDAGVDAPAIETLGERGFFEWVHERVRRDPLLARHLGDLLDRRWADFRNALHESEPSSFCRHFARAGDLDARSFGGVVWSLARDSRDGASDALRRLLLGFIREAFLRTSSDQAA